MGRRSVAKGMVRIAGSGAFVEDDQPRASVQGALTWSILTLPDSVRRRPTLFQLCLRVLVVIHTGLWRAYSELNAWLLGGYECEDVIFCTLENSFENRQVRDNSPSVKVLEAVKN